MDEYEQRMIEVAGRLSPENHSTAVEIASVPATIRGFGHVKERNAEAAAALNERLMKKFKTPVGPRGQGENRKLATA